MKHPDRDARHSRACLKLKHSKSLLLFEEHWQTLTSCVPWKCEPGMGLLPSAIVLIKCMQKCIDLFPKQLNLGVVCLGTMKAGCEDGF